MVSASIVKTVSILIVRVKKIDKVTIVKILIVIAIIAIIAIIVIIMIKKGVEMLSIMWISLIITIWMNNKRKKKKTVSRMNLIKNKLILIRIRKTYTNKGIRWQLILILGNHLHKLLNKLTIIELKVNKWKEGKVINNLYMYFMNRLK